MKLSINFTFLFFSLCILSSYSIADSKEEIREIAVVVNSGNRIENLTSKQVSDIFLNRRRAFPSGEPVMVLEQEWDGSLREIFFRLLNGMTLKRINAYWARLQFSGEVQPPSVMPDNTAMLDAVRKNQNAIGYIPSRYVDESVRVVLVLKK